MGTRCTVIRGGNQLQFPQRAVAIIKFATARRVSRLAQAPSHGPWTHFSLVYRGRHSNATQAGMLTIYVSHANWITETETALTVADGCVDTHAYTSRGSPLADSDRTESDWSAGLDRSAPGRVRSPTPARSRTASSGTRVCTGTTVILRARAETHPLQHFLFRMLFL